MTLGYFYCVCFDDVFPHTFHSFYDSDYDEDIINKDGTIDFLSVCTTCTAGFINTQDNFETDFWEEGQDGNPFFESHNSFFDPEFNDTVFPLDWPMLG